MCVDEEHVRALAYQAAEWHKPGIKPVGSAGKTVVFHWNGMLHALMEYSSRYDSYCQST